MLIDASSVQGRAARLVEEGARLRAIGLEQRADSLARAAAHLSALGADPGAIARLAESSGLGAEMTRWALETTLASVRPEALVALGRAALEPAHPGARAVPARLSALVLSGNVLTAPVRAMFVPLLLGVPVLAKASSRDDLLPRLILEALDAAGGGLAEGCDVVTLAGDSSVTATLFDQADVVSVYGSDATVRAVRASAPATAEVVAHGHGLGVVYVDGVPASGEPLSSLGRAIGEDVAAYDQRGCLSPHVVYARGTDADGERLAEAIHDALAALATERPRGALPLASGAAQVQWRGVAAVRGTLLEGDGFSVSYEAEHPRRLSPGYRNVAVHRCEGVAALAEALGPLGVHLKALGFGGEAIDPAALARALPPPLAPRLSPVGTMQTPPIDALADGRAATYGFVRYVETDVRRR
jgi:hypothetical protein